MLYDYEKLSAEAFVITKILRFKLGLQLGILSCIAAGTAPAKKSQGEDA